MNEKLFIENWVSKIQSAGVKRFPYDFIDESQLEVIPIPIKTLILGQEFFGGYEIITTDGEQVYQALNLDEARFFIYSSKDRNGKSYLPKDISKAATFVLEYNKYLDNLLDEIKRDYRISFFDGKNLLSTTTAIFQKLNLIRY